MPELHHLDTKLSKGLVATESEELNKLCRIRLFHQSRVSGFEIRYFLPKRRGTRIEDVELLSGDSPCMLGGFQEYKQGFAIVCSYIADTNANYNHKLGGLSDTETVVLTS